VKRKCETLNLGEDWIDWVEANGKIVMTEKTSGRLRRGILLCASLCLAAAGAGAGSNSTYSFLRADVGARAAALAGSFVSITDDRPPSSTIPPPWLPWMPTAGRQASSNTSSISTPATWSTRASLKIWGISGRACSIPNYGSFTETDENGNERGNFSAGDVALALGYGNTIRENLYWGGPSSSSTPPLRGIPPLRSPPTRGSFS